MLKLNMLIIITLHLNINLNTSYVKVKQQGEAAGIKNNILFKYILC